MTKRSRLKGNAFDWAENTTGEKKTSVKEQETPAKSKQKTTGTAPEKENAATTTVPSTASSRAKKRVIFVQYKKDDGQIVAMQEILHKPEKAKAPPWLEIPDDREARRINLTADIADKKLVEIHQNYKVKKSGRSVKLVPKG